MASVAIIVIAGVLTAVFSDVIMNVIMACMDIYDINKRNRTTKYITVPIYEDSDEYEAV